jgi:glutamate/tyrosine decarboxylase-like PLP-dependent enzyme
MHIAPELEALRQRNAPLEMQPDEFRQIGHRLVDQIADRLAMLPCGRVTPDESPADVRRALGAERTLPPAGTDAGRLMSEATGLLFDHSLFNGHPRFFGYITSSPAPIGMFADFLAAALNQNVGARQLSPLATEIEGQAVRWIAELIGFPQNCGGLLVSGGNMANFVGFFSARAAKAPWPIREAGAAAEAGRRMVLYVSAETHTWVQKAADRSGMGTSAIRWIETDASLRMNLDALQRAIDRDRADGLLPFLVVGTGGSVSTGAVDPLPELASICRAHDLWFHVDGAYGGFAAAAPEAPEDLRGLSAADSVAVDPHKWLYAPLEAGCALVRHPDAMRAAFAYHPPYYHMDEHVSNLVDFGFQNSRGFRALKVWLMLSHVGASGYRRMIGDDMALARALADEVRATPELEVLTQDLSITTFRFVPRALAAGQHEATLNRLNETLLDRLQREGELFVSNAVIHGRYALRACFVNFHTSMADVRAIPGIVLRTGQAVARDLGL